MSQARNRDTGPELVLRRLLHRSGLRYRVQYRPSFLSRRTIDIAFPRRHLAVFVDGCFWHGCPVHGTRPKSNRDWWASKLEANGQRDRDTDQVLRAAGWTVLRFWEHQDPAEACELVLSTHAEMALAVFPTACSPAPSGD
jgi:DNA mismatch endonuclease, patch repair protein